MTTNQRIPLAAPAALEIRCRPGRPVDVALNRSPSFRPALDTARGDGRSIHTFKLIIQIYEAGKCWAQFRTLPREIRVRARG